MEKGGTFYGNPEEAPQWHLHCIITNPSEHKEKGKCLYVHMISFKEDNPDQDCSCILNKGDHPFITRPTCINYAAAREANIDDIENAIDRCMCIEHPSLSSEVLERIREGARVSEHLPRKFKYLFDINKV